VLKIRSLDVAYGGLHALSGVSLDVGAGEFVAVVGPNGAGKSTLFKTISGTVGPVAGTITYKGKDLLAVPPGERAQHGIAHVPEGRQVFASMSVMENLEMGAYTRNGRARWRELLPMILALFPVLEERREQLAGTLSGGEQQMLAIGRGLASAPELRCSTSRRWGSRRRWSTRSSSASTRSTASTASRSCSSSSAWPRRWSPVTADTCWRPDA
jgi:branched-chain amino acid transport system ATP-binding protein